ncbi:MAG: Sec-independent protein translocase protein TatB [Alphaproteobacteria bacterium]|nr:Sec-independent protein translocase protein TatB [Alphaproteobacteria bacterium]
MFDLAWSEILLIAVVALLVIGPKQLPETLKGIARGIGKAKEAFRSFQAQADDLVKEANLQEVRDQIQDVKNTINEIRTFDIKSTIEKTVDADGSLKSAFNDPTGASTYTPPAWTPPATAATTEGAPDFIPPSTLAPYVPPPPPPPPPTAATVESAPSFLPPSTMAPPPPVVPVAEPAIPVAATPAPAVPTPGPAPAVETAPPRPATTQA